MGHLLQQSKLDGILAGNQFFNFSKMFSVYSKLLCLQGLWNLGQGPNFYQACHFSEFVLISGFFTDLPAPSLKVNKIKNGKSWEKIQR